MGCCRCIVAGASSSESRIRSCVVASAPSSEGRKRKIWDYGVRDYKRADLDTLIGRTIDFLFEIHKMDLLLIARMKYARSVKIKRERMSSSSRFAVQSTCIVCVLLGESRQTEAISSFRFECSRSVKGLLLQ
nr:hypothetical protein Iba_chr01aCG5500 [Ipomoea batatas]GME16316.1 hypothetical protein Iba_scaffold17361CG0010 [Ipomoea batatas]